VVRTRLGPLRAILSSRSLRSLPARIETLIARLRGEKPHGGTPKIRELLARWLDGEVRGPEQFQ
jgi:hypothetical protein